MNFISFLMRENITPSNVVEMKTGVTKFIKSKRCYASSCSDLLQNNSLQFSVASIGVHIRISDNSRLRKNYFLNINYFRKTWEWYLIEGCDSFVPYGITYFTKSS